MNELERTFGIKSLSGVKTIFYAMIAEMDLTVINVINLFFMSRFLGMEGAAAYEVAMPCTMVLGAFIVLGYNGVQAVCNKDYGAKDAEAFERHKNAGYTWLLCVLTAVILFFVAVKGPMLELLGACEGSRALEQLSSECYTMILVWVVPQGFFSIASCLLFIEEKGKLLVANLILYPVIFAGDIFVTVSGPTMIGYMAINAISVAAADIYIILSCFLLQRRRSKTAMTAFNLRIRDIREVFLTGFPDFMEYGFVAVFFLAENNYMLYRFSESLVAGSSVFEALDNIPEVICVGFAFLVTGTLGTQVGALKSASSPEEAEEAGKALDLSARQLTKGGIIGALAVAAALILTARPLVGIFMADEDPVAMYSAVLLTVSNAIGFVLYILNTEMVCYYKIVGAYIPAHMLFFGEALVFPLASEIILGELFGLTGFCIGYAMGEAASFLLNICIVWRTAGHFPRRLSDFRLDRYLERMVHQHVNSEEEI